MSKQTDTTERGLETHIAHYLVDKNKYILAQAEPEIIDMYPTAITGKWIRSQQPILENNHQRFFQHLITLDKSLNNPTWQHLYKRKICIVGILFPEEVAWRVNKDGWLFFIMQQRKK